MFHDLPPEFLYSAYKIEVTFSDGTTNKTIQGTAFVVGLESGRWALVTNRHVIEIDYKATNAKYKDFRVAAIRVTGRRADDSVYRFTVNPGTPAWFPSSYLDDVGLLVDPSCSPMENMSEMKLFFHFGLEHLADDEFLKSLKPFDVLAFAGFPEEHDQLGERPILRGGRIASDPRFDFSLSGKPSGRCVAYEAFSHGGASGSPVFAPPKGLSNLAGSRHGKLVGVNAGHVNQQSGSHAALSYFYRSTVVLEVLRACGAI